MIFQRIYSFYPLDTIYVILTYLIADVVVVTPVDCVSPGGGTLPVQTLQLESNKWWACWSVVSFKSESSADETDVSSLIEEDSFRSPLVDAPDGSIFVWH